AEGAPSPGHDDHGDVSCPLEAPESLFERRGDLTIERIERVGALESQARHGAIDGEARAHRPSLARTAVGRAAASRLSRAPVTSPLTAALRSAAKRGGSTPTSVNQASGTPSPTRRCCRSRR